MSSVTRIHKFCTSEGVLLSDESISFDEYLALDIVDAGDVETQVPEQSVAQAAAVPRLSVYYRSPASTDAVSAVAAPTLEGIQALGGSGAGYADGQGMFTENESMYHADPGRRGGSWDVNAGSCARSSRDE